MFDFEDAVKILLEGPPAATPKWWKDVIKAYNKANPTITSLTDSWPSGDLDSSITPILVSSSNISPKSYKQAYVPIVDLCRWLAKTLLAKGFKSGNSIELIDNVNSNLTNFGINTVIANWLKRTDLTYDQYGESQPFLHVDISEAERKRKKEIDDLGDVAIGTIDRFCILPATQEIINRRTAVVSRLTAFKGPREPFGNLLYDIFDDTPAYVSGIKSISGDFEKIVDGNLYISEIIKIAVYARLFYESIKCYTAPPESGTPETEPEPTPPGEPKPPKKTTKRGSRGGGGGDMIQQGAINTMTKVSGRGNKVINVFFNSGKIDARALNSFIKTLNVRPEKPPRKTKKLLTSSLKLNTNNNFSILIESILNEVGGIPGIGIAAYIKDIPTNIINYLKQMRKDNEFMDFVKRGIVFLHDCSDPDNPIMTDAAGNNLYITDSSGTKPQIFTLGVINTMTATNQSAKDLMNVFARIAQYQRTSMGASERFAAGANAAAGIAAIGGVKAGLAM